MEYLLKRNAATPTLWFYEYLHNSNGYLYLLYAELKSRFQTVNEMVHMYHW